MFYACHQDHQKRILHWKFIFLFRLRVLAWRWVEFWDFPLTYVIAVTTISHSRVHDMHKPQDDKNVPHILCVITEYLSARSSHETV